MRLRSRNHATAAAVLFALTAIDVGDAQDPHLVGPEQITDVYWCNIVLPPDSGDGNYATNIWPDAIVPYYFDTNVGSTNQQRARDAMSEIEAVSRVVFIECKNQCKSEVNYIRIRDSSNDPRPRDSSWVGMREGEQTINITSWPSRFKIVHELMHSLGLWHEHQRTDRGRYVQM